MSEICSLSFSDAWLRAVTQAMNSLEHEISPLVVVIELTRGAVLEEDFSVRNALDEALLLSGNATVETVSNTIFPNSLWNPGRPRAELFDRYQSILPKVRRYPPNRRGVYFERFMSYPGKRGQRGRNQLDDIISSFRKGNHRRSALQLGVFVPEVDINDSRQLGFPCLQQVAFEPDASRGSLAVTGFYAMQYLFRRAYGNYVGLARLGQFVAHELGLALERVVCVSAVARLDVSLRIAQSVLDRYPSVSKAKV